MKSLLAPLVVFLALSLTSIAVTSCGATDCKDPANAGSVKCTVINSTKECGGAAFDQLVTEQAPGFEHAIGSAIQGDGSIDYNAALPVLEDYGFRFGGCLVTELFARLSHAHFATLATTGGAPRPTPKAVADTYRTFRATHYTGVEFKTPSGTP